MSCWFRQCDWIYLVSVERADPSFIPGTQGQVGLYQCRRCKTLSLGAATAPANRRPYDAAKHQACYP
jgi:hypothetical protein